MHKSQKLRGKVIAEHSKVIAAFVDTSERPFGQIALKKLFEAADTDGSGTLDKEEVRNALTALVRILIAHPRIRCLTIGVESALLSCMRLTRALPLVTGVSVAER